MYTWPPILWVSFMYTRSLNIKRLFYVLCSLILWVFFMYRASFIWSFFMYNYSLYRLRNHPMLHPLYIKRTHNSIDRVTLLWDNFMYFHIKRNHPMLRPLYIKKTLAIIFMYSAFYCRDHWSWATHCVLHTSSIECRLCPNQQAPAMHLACCTHSNLL